VQQILTMQAREAAALAAHASGDAAGTMREMEAAVAIEDSIDSLSQPPYPIIPAHELYGSLLMEMGRPAEAGRHFEETLRRTPAGPRRSLVSRKPPRRWGMPSRPERNTHA
jgi:hypothetical protein